jgi:hypothetical protein
VGSKFDSIRTLKISGLILRHELLFPPTLNFQRGNLLYKLVSSTNLGERFTLANSANLKTCIPSKVNKKKKVIMMRLIQKLEKFDTNNQKIHQHLTVCIYQKSSITLV